MGGYRISQLAQRSGFPASTLRFYESQGLLPAGRTASGYRVYDDEAVARLDFIGSAKHLGLPLDEIGELLEVRDLGVCAAVRERMLPLVLARLADAERRIAELSSLSAQLAGVAEQLSGPSTAGACAAGCGCADAPATTTVLVDLTPAWRPEPVICHLAGGELTARTREWHQLLAVATAREPTSDGWRITFPRGADLAADIVRLASAEQDCCAFFDFALQLTTGNLVLTVRAPEAASVLLAELFEPAVP